MRIVPRRNHAVVILANGKGEAKIDLDDIPKVDGTAWCLHTGGYAQSPDSRYMHRVIMDAPKGKDVDHINGDRLDNRKANLRTVTRSQNLHNRHDRPYHGVTWRKDKRKWRARITVDLKEIFLGHFDTLEDAVRARRDAETAFNLPR